MIRLSELKPGQIAWVDKIDHQQSDECLIRRLEALGLTPNKPVQVLRQAGFGGPLHLRVGSTTEIAIRRQEANHILVTRRL